MSGIDRSGRTLAVLAGAAMFFGCGGQTESSGSSASGHDETLSYTTSNVDFFRDAIAGRLGDEPVELSGRLYLPEGDGPFSVVVFQHGSGAPFRGSKQYGCEHLRLALKKENVGYFEADSFSGRGISGTSGDQAKLSRASRVVDALRALEALARHPRIDGNRIGISGTSFGGIVSYYASHESFPHLVLPDGPRFVAHLPLYPSCMSRIEPYEWSGAPLLFLVGGADNYTKAGFCVEMVETWAEAGVDVEIVVYPGAHRGFIARQNRVEWLPDAWHANECGVGVVGPDGELRGEGYRSDGLSWPEFLHRLVRSGCFKQGASMGGNREASRDSLERATAFFVSQLKG